MKTLILLLSLFMVINSHAQTIYDFKVSDIEGHVFDLATLKGKKVMFESIEIFGASNQQVSLKIGFSGSK